MKNIKILFNIFLLIFINIAYGQKYDTFNYIEKNVDNITISTINFQDKTTYIPTAKEDSIYRKKDSISGLSYYADPEIKESISCTGKSKLNKKETILLFQNLQKIELGHALPYQYDIQLDFYKKNKIVQTVTISSETKNLVIKKTGCKTHIDENKQEIDPCFFRGMVSQSLKKYIVSLLKSKKLWNKEQQFMEDYK
ncbi:hypothetical protein QWZ06_16545 [Chryseobacterium tructae]|uniref:DUF4468 domain-containing protein n=1 Tax=Chryseobacterium tructae TaxID=1037380 RepID=A0ABV7Y0Y4_9FLAO|nr:hypothetical protein [Chryseobacterium tructae]MDN3693786.1 hypothetical protein [Chryseobacterium tructae]